MAVGAQLSYVAFLKDVLGQQNTLFQKTKAALETPLPETNARLDAELTEMTAHRDCLLDEVDRISSERIVYSVDLNTIRRQSGATRTEFETVRGQFTE